MSTIYTFHAECSSVDSLADADRFLVYDASTGRTEYALASQISTYAASDGLVGAQLSGDSNYSSTASFSFIIGSTLSSRIGFYGKAGTSQPAGAAQAQYTNTVENPSTCTGVVGFSTTAAMQDALGLLMQMRTTLVNVGLMKGSA
jgi:hypothetical protein